MYRDPKRPRKKLIAFRLNDYEHEALMKLSAERGDQFGTMIRELLLAEASRQLEAMQLDTPEQMKAEWSKAA